MTAIKKKTTVDTLSTIIDDLFTAASIHLQVPVSMLKGERLKDVDVDVDDEDIARYMNFISVKVIPHVST